MWQTRSKSQEDNHFQIGEHEWNSGDSSAPKGCRQIGLHLLLPNTHSWWLETRKRLGHINTTLATTPPPGLRIETSLTNKHGQYRTKSLECKEKSSRSRQQNHFDLFKDACEAPHLRGAAPASVDQTQWEGGFCKKCRQGAVTLDGPGDNPLLHDGTQRHPDWWDKANPKVQLHQPQRGNPSWNWQNVCNKINILLMKTVCPCARSSDVHVLYIFPPCQHLHGSDVTSIRGAVLLISTLGKKCSS